jgi:hypothetical protein
MEARVAPVLYHMEPHTDYYPNGNCDTLINLIAYLASSYDPVMVLTTNQL